MFTTKGPPIGRQSGSYEQTFEELPPAIRNPFCRKYERCLNQAARHNLTDIDCRRCHFSGDKSGAGETGLYAAAYLELVRVIMNGVSQPIGLPR
jgi:hypothetical protein